MVDSFDRAQALEQRQRDEALKVQLARFCPTGPSLRHCKDCGQNIPPARQALGGITRCVLCQSAFERRGRR
ncbi:TraR/DksA family transcriptional regulator [Pseudomonas huanghezhanensis]|uniref:TraR/DksA family transcriptional regulator n=1 Tax=Pseudomonas huanghezhanensis TaxID=3002903 RepID=UPI0022866FB2|nr:TraR/DksA family transcriptional regulator [Pseudomonas sp. BSw22131]